MGAQGEAGIGVRRFGQHVDDLLYVLDVHFVASVKVLDVDAGEATGVL